MDCNNTLTATQLKEMFATTDKEKRQIEQPMNCPIEKTQHRCKKCVRFFSNKMSHCGKAVNCTNNL